MNATAARPSIDHEAHYYTRAGQPMHRVKKKTGPGDRPTRIDDARKLDLLPSVTTKLKALNRPQLVNYRIEQACLAVLTAPRTDQEPLDEFVHRVLHEEKQQDEERNAAAQLGSRIHAEIDFRLTAKEIGEPDLDVYVMPVLAQINYLGRVVWTEKVVVAEDYAGRFDCLVEGNDLWLLDFKTCKTMPDKFPWWEHGLQLSAYAAALGNTGDKRLRCANLYISTVLPGESRFFEVENWPDKFQRGFQPISKYWNFANNFRKE